MAQRESVMSKVAKLLALAADEGATGPERARAAALADKLMAEHMIERSELTPEQRSRITTDTWEVATHKAGEFDGHVIGLMERVTRHCGCRATGKWEWENGKGYKYVLTVVGYPEDIRYAETMFYRSFVEFVNNINPQWDTSESLGHNTYVFKQAGFTWNEIWRLAYKNGMHPRDPYGGKEEGRVLGRAYKAEVERRGEVLKRNTQTHKAYRLSYASGFASQIGQRLEDLRKGTEEQISDKDKFALARLSTDADVEAEFYRLFPEFDPSNIAKEAAERRAKKKAEFAAMSPQQQREFLRARAEAEAKREKEARAYHNRMRKGAKTYDQAGWEHGTKIANNVDLSNNAAAGDKKKGIA